MVKSASLVVALAVHLVFRVSIFFNFDHCPSTTTPIASLLIIAAISVVMLGYNTPVPCCEGSEWNLTHTMIESVGSLVCLELLMSVVWCRFEMLVLDLAKMVLSEEVLVIRAANVMELCIGAALLAYALIASGKFTEMKNQFKMYRQCRSKPCCPNVCPIKAPVVEPPICCPVEASPKKCESPPPNKCECPSACKC